MDQLTFFRRLSILEGISLLVLVFIAMPIKYLAGNPMPVRYVGMLHGVLFILYCINLLYISKKLEWSFKFMVMAFVSSIFPFGMLYLDRKLKIIEKTNET